jgi:2-hydroxycyclohexanecarboxyl-CoA dehydrogenase
VSRGARVTFPGTVAVVTGAGRGIGRATALALADAGSIVVCADIDGEAAENAAAECGERGPEATAVVVDVASGGAVTALAGKVERDTGPVGILVNNAGVGMTGRFEDTTLDDWAWIRGVNLDGVVNGCCAFGAHMVRRGGGQVVNVSSALAYVPTSTEAAYGATKAAVLAFSRCLRADWARAGVGVTAVCPGLINTPIIGDTRFVGDDGARRERMTKVFRRGHKPERVASAVMAGIERDRGVVMVGAEARAGWLMHRFAPVALQQSLAAHEGPGSISVRKPRRR